MTALAVLFKGTAKAIIMNKGAIYASLYQGLARLELAEPLACMAYTYPDELGYMAYIIYCTIGYIA